ncbi:MAG: T9SS type A sorting domain-containing protein [Lewinellaceae bacterium]|nr:T9SS type A sorting domain-containing protein [Lewinellaceae bacterium]
MRIEAAVDGLKPPFDRRILDVNGTPLIHDQSFNRADSVNVSALPAGLYFLQVANGGIPAVSKFFKK